MGRSVRCGRLYQDQPPSLTTKKKKDACTYPRVDVVAKGEAALLVVAGGELGPVHEGQEPGRKGHGEGHGEEVGHGGRENGVETLVGW